MFVAEKLIEPMLNAEIVPDPVVLSLCRYVKPVIAPEAGPRTAKLKTRHERKDLFMFRSCCQFSPIAGKCFFSEETKARTVGKPGCFCSWRSCGPKHAPGAIRSHNIP